MNHKKFEQNRFARLIWTKFRWTKKRGKKFTEIWFTGYFYDKLIFLLQSNREPELGEQDLQYWQIGPLLSLKADEDPRMTLQFLTINYFIGIVEGRHPQSKTEEGRFGSVRPQGNFTPDSIVYSSWF